MQECRASKARETHNQNQSSQSSDISKYASIVNEKVGSLMSCFNHLMHNSFMCQKPKTQLKFRKYRIISTFSFVTYSSHKDTTPDALADS